MRRTGRRIKERLLARTTILLGMVLGVALVTGCERRTPLPPLPSTPAAQVASPPGVAPVDGPTLKAVRARGRISCGVADDLRGFASRDVLGQWRGFDVDFCRAVAAAVFGDARKVQFVSLTYKQRFTALQNNQVDLIARSGLSYGRDTGLGLDFVGVNFFDGQGFLVRKPLEGKTAADLAGLRLCVQAGTSSELNLTEYYRDAIVRPSKVLADSEKTAVDAYVAGDCDALSENRAALASVRTSLRGADGHVVLPDEISKDPQGPVVRQGDSQWADLVRWTLNAMLLAEEMGVTSKTVAEQRSAPSSPEIGRLLAGDGLGQQLLLEDDWAFQVIRQVGNYGEIFERNLGAESDLGIERGRNALWNAASPGLLYAPPMR